MTSFGAMRTVRASLDWRVSVETAHYLAVAKADQPYPYARLKALPWADVSARPASISTGRPQPPDPNQRSKRHLASDEFPRFEAARHPVLARILRRR
ncbi:hypothetical protein [Frankia tisae]|uniref:hypothetical protein n=1 Tax=Frankia tisae TaxID=2950104 RepID=UPI0021C0A083|nr:hypothetical protein [Frankia tisae]